MKILVLNFILIGMLFCISSLNTQAQCIDPNLIDSLAICPAIYNPVCGCNGVTYGNDCMAKTSGVTSWIAGECSTVIDCINPLNIDPTFACYEIYDPVCGCDGVTYSNDCYAAHYGGVMSWTPGACNNNGTCVDSTKIDVSVLCDTEYKPVCGCDNKTYNNQCEAEYYGGVTSWTPGECGIIIECINLALIDSSAICPAIYAPVCGCNGVTYVNDCEAQVLGGVTSWTPGECGIMNCIDPSKIDSTMGCPDVWAPVCGCNGVTYSNICEALNYGGVTSWTNGTCNANPDCAALFTYTDSLGVLTFTNLSSSATNYEWHISTPNTDSTFSYLQTPEPLKVGISPVLFLYNICLTIHNETSNPPCTTSFCKEIGISGCYMYPSFTYNILPNNVVEFTNTTVGLPMPNTFSWDFGDGLFSNEENPTHTFANNNNEGYNVCLTTDSFFQGCSSTTDCFMVYPSATGISTNKLVSNFTVSPKIANQSAIINYYLPSNQVINISLFNVLGCKVKNIVNNELQQAGNHTLNTSFLNLPNGMYIFELNANGSKINQKIIVAK